MFPRFVQYRQTYKENSALISHFKAFLLLKYKYNVDMPICILYGMVPSLNMRVCIAKYLWGRYQEEWTDFAHLQTRYKFGKNIMMYQVWKSVSLFESNRAHQPDIRDYMVRSVPSCYRFRPNTPE